MRLGKQKEEEEEEKEKKKDYLEQILEKLSLSNIEVLNPEQALEVKNEALKRLKQRLLTRAEIIQQRLEAETKTLENAFVSILTFSQS